MDATSLNLSRLLARLENTLFNPDTETAHRLRTSRFERNKVGVNIDNAKALLTRLESTRKSHRLTSSPSPDPDLLHLHEQLEALDARLHELQLTGQEFDDATDNEEDISLLLGDITPSADNSLASSYHDVAKGTPVEAHTSDDEDDEEYERILKERRSQHPSFNQKVEEPEVTVQKSARDELFPSELRTRHAGAAEAGATSTGTSTSAPPMTEALLQHNRTEQEELTSSLLSMAQALKASSQSFSASLESEKGTVDRAVEGLDRNVGGLEAASRRMGYLRQMSEGKGWWGRMMLYAWIFGLMLTSFFVVAFMPKLRF